MKLDLYYGLQLVESFTSFTQFRERFYSNPDRSDEIYQGGYLRISETVFPSDSGWFRCNHTPVPTEDVPKHLRALALLLM